MKVPKDVDLKLLGPLACGVMTGAGGMINTLRPEPGSSVVVFGCGTVGLSALMASKIIGCDPRIVVDNKQSRLDWPLSWGQPYGTAPRESMCCKRSGH